MPRGNMYFSVAVLVLVGAVLAACDDDDGHCPRFEYDRELLEKLVRVEAENEVCKERLGDIEDELRSLRNDFISLADEIHVEIDKTVAKATEKMIHIPEIESEETDGWKIVFRATAGNGQHVFKAWTEGIDVTTIKPKDMKKSLSKHYLNMNLMNEWTTRVNKVKFSLFENQLEVAYIIFDGQGTSRNTWFNQSRVIQSSWPTLLMPKICNYFSAEGHPEVKRRFFINLNYGGCPKDKGYLTVVDTGIATQHICDWDHQATFPQFLYSKANGPTVWNHFEYGLADYMAIFIK